MDNMLAMDENEMDRTARTKNEHGNSSSGAGISPLQSVSATAVHRVACFCLAMAVMASICNAMMDKISFHYDISVFASPRLAAYRFWLDPRVSWPNKWKNGRREEGEAFPLSSTALVFVTDAWHLLKGIAKACIILALMAPFTLLYRLPVLGWCGVFVALHLLSGLVFEAFFAWLLVAPPA